MILSLISFAVGIIFILAAFYQLIYDISEFGLIAFEVCAGLISIIFGIAVW